MLQAQFFGKVGCTCCSYRREMMSSYEEALFCAVCIADMKYINVTLIISPEAECVVICSVF